MSTEIEIFNVATDIANCVPTGKYNKIRLRDSVFKLVISTAERAAKDPNLIDKMKQLHYETKGEDQ